MEFSEYNMRSLVDHLKEYKMVQELEDYRSIVEGVAYKYSKSISRYDYDDLVQDLWLKILTIQKNTDSRRITHGLIASSCYNRAVDLYRKDLRRSVEDQSDQQDRYSQSPNVPSGYEVCILKEIIDLYPSGSLERKYLVMKFVNNGILDEDYLDDADQEDAVILDNNIEREYVRNLGHYSSDCPGSWIARKREIKRRVRELISGGEIK